ncbi:protein FAR-RED IMPAIRED RESPONSE 1-like [Camellia sinensis]|uniref:protein FAR-RED IMPAIRED RESPONSE 1-like n=1 Tax=Camellia sinensis TaxID=4442 RepID=UPI0010362134|nr:protein FAR-RED IMPAIRED RESPONSE 1-like [Camellia sinensis]
MNVEDGRADVKQEMVNDAHRNDMVSDVERAILEQKFDSVEDGKAFYNAEGQRLPKYLDRVAEKSRAPKALTIVGCKVQFRIRYNADAGEGGKYVVTHFVAEHNHELAEQHCVMYLRSHRGLNSADKGQAMAMHNVGVKTSQIMDYMVNQSGSYENVGSSVRICTTIIKPNVEQKLRMVMCRTDSKSRADYVKFGDMLIFDSTYRTNAYKKPFVMLAGVTNHFRTTIFACVLLANETFDTYTWVLEIFMEAMGNKAPMSVLTDGDRGDCMDMETNEAKFEDGWARMGEKFGLQTNSWVLETYEKRHMWAEAYMRGHFFAGMKSTQRSESMNAYFKPFLQHKLKLYEFVRHYDQALARISITRLEMIQKQITLFRY